MQTIPMTTGRQGVAIFLAFFALGVAAAAFTGYPEGIPCQDAVVRCGIGEDLLAGLTRGRQGLVGSLRWAPLPTLAVLPLLKVTREAPLGLAACAAAAGAYALLCAFLNSWWARLRLPGALRLGALLAFFASPAVQGHIARGSSDAILVLVGVGTVCFLIEWWETDELRPLAYLSLLLPLGMATRYQFGLIFVVVLLAVFLHLRLRRRGHFYAQGTLIIVGTPALYIAALWVAANWLIMGEPFFFLRGLPWQTLRAIVQGGHMSASLAERICSAGSAWLTLVHEGCAWEVLVLPLLMALAGWAGARVFRRHPRIGALPCVVVALLILCLPESGTSWREAESTWKMARVVRQLETTDSEAAILVSGYRGHDMRYLASPALRARLEHTISVYLDEALRRTRGKRLYVIVPPPRGLNRWEDINIKFQTLYGRGTNFALYERSLDDWQLWQVVRIDQP